MRIAVQLSRSSVRQAIQELRRYKDSLPVKMDRIMQQLGQIGVDAAVGTIRMSEMDVAAAIRVEKDGHRGYLIISDDERAAFAEFGTGVMGEGTYPGELPAEWGYDLRWTPAAHDPVHPEKWYYYDDENRRRWTWGQTADAYMFAGSQIMRQMVIPIAKDVFER